MRSQSGFTISELMFATVGISVLLIILLGATLQLSRTYNKGLTLKRVNQSGRTIGDELTRSIRQAGGATLDQNQSRLCLGSTSFVWENPEAEDGSENKYEDGSLVEGLVKANENLCESPPRAVAKDKATQLLDDGLVVKRMEQVATPSNQLVAIRYTISTPGAGAVCGGGDDFCAFNTFDIAVYARGY